MALRVLAPLAAGRAEMQAALEVLAVTVELEVAEEVLAKEALFR
jgi:hypothetical protein